MLRLRDGASSERPDTLAAEEPMEIRVGGRALTVTMRTPGDDFDLATGFLVSEGVVDVALAPGVAALPDRLRPFPPRPPSPRTSPGRAV